MIGTVLNPLFLSPCECVIPTRVARPGHRRPATVDTLEWLRGNPGATSEQAAHALGTTVSASYLCLRRLCIAKLGEKKWPGRSKGSTEAPKLTYTVVGAVPEITKAIKYESTKNKPKNAQILAKTQVRIREVG